MDVKVSYAAARLPALGLLSCEGDDARAFLHAQLTSDIVNLDAQQARRAGWCSAKGRLLATFLVVPVERGFLLQLSRDLAPAVAKRLSLFVLRAKVRLTDASESWTQLGVWGAGAAARLEALGLAVPGSGLGCARTGAVTVVHVGPERFLLLSPADEAPRLTEEGVEAGEDEWFLQDIRAGVPRVLLATQEAFVPQMINLERLGAVDFQKGCYPGQEIVARTQYRGVLKRRMVGARVAAAAAPGDELFAREPAGQPAGQVVNAVAHPEGGCELLAVLQISTLEDGGAVRLRSREGPLLEVRPLPYA
jgi:folate-binding protein YgfZ